MERVLHALTKCGKKPVKSGDGYTCCCPGHADHKPSLTIRIGENGQVLLYCFAECTFEAICKALDLRQGECFPDDSTQRNRRGSNSRKRSAVTKTPTKPAPEGVGDSDKSKRIYSTPEEAVLAYGFGEPANLWRYQDAKGIEVGVIARWDKETGKDFRPVSLTSDGAGWRQEQMPSPRPLYGLPQLLAASAGSVVYIFEGEKSADAARRCGLLATTSVGGAKATSKTDYAPLVARVVVISPDHDQPGEEYATAGAGFARAAGAKSIRIIRLVDLWDAMPKGGDIADLLEHRDENGEEVKVWIENLVNKTEEAAMAQAKNAAPTQGTTTQADRIITLVRERYRFGQNGKGQTFLVPRTGRNVAVWLSGSGGVIKDEVAFAYYEEFNSVMNATAFADALATLRGEAKRALCESVHLRVGRDGKAIVLDLGTDDGAAVRIEAGKWSMLERSPILFQRTPLGSALPTPTSGGSLESFRKVLNVSDETWPILLGWLVAALIPDMPHPILMLGGGQGTGKTTAARFICGLFDPSTVPTQSQPRDPEAWATSITGSWASVIDNISSIQSWWSDSLCKAVTGDGFIKRMLYTDNDLCVMSFQRVIVLTSIDAGALRGDLGERLVLIDLEQIESRKTQSELDAMYDEMRPAILGALLDLVAGVLAKLDSVQVAQLPRMADFAKVLAAMDGLTGLNAFSLYMKQEGRIASDVLDADCVASGFLDWSKDAGRLPWTGTASALRELIAPDHPERSWPSSAKAFAGRLRRLIPALKAQGIRVTPPKADGHHRNWFIETTAPTAP